MSEQKSQGWFVPLRVRFRSATERAQWERDSPSITVPQTGRWGILPGGQVTNESVWSKADVECVFA